MGSLILTCLINVLEPGGLTTGKYTYTCERLWARDAYQLENTCRINAHICRGYWDRFGLTLVVEGYYGVKY